MYRAVWVFVSLVLFFGAGMEPRALDLLTMHSATKLHPQPLSYVDLSGFSVCMKPGIVTMPVTPAFRRLRQKDCEFQASLGYIKRVCLKKPNQPTTNKKTQQNCASVSLSAVGVIGLQNDFQVFIEVFISD
jgi:hypothetical protein